jgi:acetyl-CoA C-acetyltransferase
MLTLRRRIDNSRDNIVTSGGRCELPVREDQAMTEAFIATAVRTPVGRRGGSLSTVHPADLAARTFQALIERAGIEPADVDDVIFGCVAQVGAQAINIARTAWLSAGLPESVPGTTIDRQCGSSQQAVHFAAQAVRSGAADMVVAGGVEVMSSVPIGSSASAGTAAGYGEPFAGQGWRNRFGEVPFDQIRSADLIAEKWGIDRAAMEQYALVSHERALTATAAGRFTDEIVPVNGLAQDEGPRVTSLERMARLKLLPGMKHLTAAHASQISDGAAAVLIASDTAITRWGLTPLARIHAMTVVGSDPVLMLTGPIPATEKVLRLSGLALSDIGHIEINEAFAPVVLAWQQETGADLDLVNPYGGAIALGHPLGATGARLMTTLAYGMRASGIRYGLQVMCEGGGMANATVLESI